MHVFIDTNILLNFYHFSKDELESLNDVFATHEHGSAKVYLTQQVSEEFKRNRENKIKDALKRFKNNKFSAELPSFMKGYSEYQEIRRLSSEIQLKQKGILEKVNKDITEKNLLADRLLSSILKEAEILTTSEDVYQKASMRMSLGNPPGKNGSIGDAVNWIVLLDSVPQNENIHIISEDGDFYSIINEKMVCPFLSEDWSTIKDSEVFVYRSLSEFMAEHFDGVAFAFDKNKAGLIDDLQYSGNFATTHSLIAKLEEYSYFSQKEVTSIFKAIDENNQVRNIITDLDLSDFLNRVAVPYLADITNDTHIGYLNEVIEEQNERE